MSRQSHVVGIALKSLIGDFEVAFNLGDVATFICDNWGSVQVDLVVDDQERVVRIHNVIVNGDTVQVLLKQVLEEKVLFLKSRLLLLDGQLVKVDFVEPLVEVVEHLELLESGGLVQTRNLLNVDVGLIHRVRVALVEGQHLLLLSLELSAELGRL